MNVHPDLFSTALKMLSSLVIVLGGMFVVFYFMKRVLKRDTVASKEKLIRVLSNTYLGVKKNISLVEVPGALLVLGITNDNISLLSKIEDKDILDNLKRHEDDHSQSSFSSHLHRLSEKIKTRDKQN
ncbi:MAG: flagellar biosynthetic protein FliO [Deltaproteobacteria bacterium]|nr:flagellar biosynthetic protein FliO [Deltaproteobacteria bacterium]